MKTKAKDRGKKYLITMILPHLGQSKSEPVDVQVVSISLVPPVS